MFWFCTGVTGCPPLLWDSEILATLDVAFCIRGCCFQVPYNHGPQCYFKNANGTLGVTVPVTVPIGTPSRCYTATTYLGASAGRVCTDGDGLLVIEVGDGPVLLASQ